MPNTPLNNEELKQHVLESFWNVAHMSQGTAPDGGDDFLVTKKDFNEYADRVTEMFFADRAAAVREAQSSINQEPIFEFCATYWYQDKTGYYFDTQPRHKTSVQASNQADAIKKIRSVLPSTGRNSDFTLRVRIDGFKELQSQPNAKEE